MGFDARKFRHAKWESRTEEVRVPGLADFFDEDEKHVFRVRGLDGREMARMREEGTEGRKRLIEIANKIASGDAGAVAEAVEGLSQPESAKLYMEVYAVETGCVEPKLSRQDVLILHQHRHAEFIMIANAILRLSGEGSLPGKLTPSGQTKKSKPHSRSGNSEGDSSSNSDPTSSPTGD